jgi:DNA-binding response OmpR family regulator
MDGAEQHHKLCVHVAKLRRKIEPDPARPRLLRTEPGIGYRFGDARRSPPAVYGNAGPPNG